MVDPKSDDWLPEGWRVEVKIRRNGRRDKCYVPPSGGDKFYSKPHVLRYLNNTNSQSANKEKRIHRLSSENFPTIVKKRNLEVNGTAGSIPSDKNSELQDIANEQMLDSASRKRMSIAEYTSNQSRGETELSSSELRGEKHSDLTVERSDSAKSVHLVAPAVGVHPDIQSLESEVTGNEAKRTGTGKSKKNKDVDLPRRASKRLAGIPLDPTPELKTTNRARRPAVNKSTDMVTSSGEGSSCERLDADREVKPSIGTPEDTKILSELNQSKQSIRHAAAPNDNATKGEKEKEGQKHDEFTVITESNGNIEMKNNGDEKPGLPLDLPIGELWQDPCIAFAIKTLTGIPFDDSDSTKGAAGSNKEHTRNEDADNGGSEKQGHATAFPPDDLSFSFADALADPCIEFAVKTLTGAIPLDYNMVVQDYLPGQSQQQGTGGLALPNVGEFCQTEFLCQQFGNPERPLFNQASARNMNLGFSGGTSQQCGYIEDRRSNRCPK